MIGLGAKYLTAAGFGRYRITAASLGNLDLLGSLGDWLTKETKQAILAAFGDDGMAVINATNKYLSGIAASDRDKATALAGFINEDPMMVCSLGLQPQGVTMPIRGMYPNGDAYIALLFELNSLTSDSEVGYRLRNASYTGSRTAMYGSKYSWQDRDLSIALGGWNNNGQAYIGYGGSYVGSFNYTKDTKPHVFRLANKKAYFDGAEKQSYSPSSFTTRPILLYRISGGGGDSNGLDSNTSITFAKIKDTNLDALLIPFIRQGANGMIDVLTGTFYPNANTSGSFTIEYTLPDGTHWTPSTP